MRSNLLIFLIAVFCAKAEYVSSSITPANDKIEDRIIDVITKFSSSYSSYAKINLSLEQFALRGDNKIFELATLNGDVYVYSYFTITLRNRKQEEKSDSTTIRCDSLKSTKIEVKLHDDVEISANVRIVDGDVLFSKGELLWKDRYRYKEPNLLGEGLVTLKLKNTNFSVQYSIYNNDSRNIEYDVTSEMSGETEVFRNIQNEEFRSSVSEKLKTTLNRVKSRLRQFSTNSLHEILNGRGISSVPEFCSEILNRNESLKKIDDLEYTINNTLFDFGGVRSQEELITIYGLSYINNTEFTVTSDHVQNNLTIRLETNNLKGKITWSVKPAPVSDFVIDYIQFEVKKRQKRLGNGSLETVINTILIRLNPNVTEYCDAKVHVENLRFNSTTNSNGTMTGDVLTHSERLKVVIASSLEASLVEKLEKVSSWLHF